MRNHYLNIVLLLAAILFGGNATAQSVSDMLTWSTLGMKNSSSYEELQTPDSAFESGAVYAGLASSNKGKAITLKGSNQSALYAAVSPGTVESIVVRFNTSSLDKRGIEIYGKHTPYASYADVYSADSTTRGALLGSVAFDKSNKNRSYTITPDSAYEYFAIRSAQDGVIYVQSVNVTWLKKPAGKKATTLSFASPKVTATLGQPFEAPVPVLLCDSTVIEGKHISYASSDNEVASFSADSTLTVNKAGKATITARFDGDEEYLPSEASYVLTVVDPDAPVVTFDFADPASLGYAVGDELPDSTQIQLAPVTLTVTTTGEAPKFVDGSLLVNKNVTLTLTAPEFLINKVSLPEGEATFEGSLTPGNLYVGSSRRVRITFADNTSFDLKSLVVSLQRITTIVLNADGYNDDVVVRSAGKIFNVVLKRPMKAGEWTLFCSPVEFKLEGTPLEGGEVKAYDRISGTTMRFSDATIIDAGHTYAVRPVADIDSLTFSEVEVGSATLLVDGNNSYSLTGTFSQLAPKPEAEDQVIMVLNADGSVSRLGADEQVSGLSGYFTVLRDKAEFFDTSMKPTETGIGSVEAKAETSGKVYNLNGQYVGTSLKNLPKGIYVVDGHKVAH